MAFYPRFAEERVRQALADTPVVAINGPRQSGKSSLIELLSKPEGRRILTLDDPATLASARQDPTGFIRVLDRAAIDEVQRAGEPLMLAIKKAVDEDRRPGRFLLSGSVNILAVKKLSESLAGRMEVISLLPLSYAEILASHGGRIPTFLQYAFEGAIPRVSNALVGPKLMEAVARGGYPDAVLRADPARRKRWFDSYVFAQTKRDIVDIASINNGDKVFDLLRMLSHYSGQLLNLTAVGGDVRIDHKTAERYIGILEQLFLVRRIEPWHRNELKRLIKTPKLHFIDSGLLASTRNLTVEKLAKDRSTFGAVLESFVGSELLKLAGWHDEVLRFHHYRDKDQHEVDFVIENQSGEVVGIEVKAGATVKYPDDFRGLQRLREAASKAFKLGVVLYDGLETLPFGDHLFAAPISSLWSIRRAKE